MSDPTPAASPLTPEKQALIALRRMRARLEEVERDRTEPIAVVGIGCRFPGEANSADEYWSLLRNGVDAVTEVPPDRWDVDAFYDPDPEKPGKMYTRYGAFVKDVDRFDAPFFRITPREAASMDPQQRLLLEVAWEALEHAGCAPDTLVGTETGVFVGIATSDYGGILLQASGYTRLDTYFGTGNAYNAASGRLSYVLGLQGPCLAIDTACSSSLVAVHLACQSLRQRECGMALAGGVNVILTPGITVNFCRARMLAADGRCKTFDASADGYVRGEGCGVVVLKRLSDAVADGDRILALIRGSAVNQDGRSGGFTAPNELAQQALIRRALAAAKLEPADVSYVEAHGTGTSLGDPIEIHALAGVFGDRPADRPLMVGSVKTNFGHLEAAAGIAGLIKTVLALKHREIPPHLHFKQLNPHISLDGFACEIPTHAKPWQNPGGRLVAGVSSFGFSGTNSHVVLEAPPDEPAPAPGPERPAHVLTLSAKSEQALRTLAGRCHAHVTAGDGGRPELADLCFTANTGRTHFEHRAALVADSPQRLRAGLAALASGSTAPGVHVGSARASDTPLVAFLFTGQGSQFAGMGRELYDTQPTFRQALDRCSKLVQGELPEPLLSVIFPAPGEGSRIDDTIFTQPALFAIEYALAELWRSWGVTPSAVLGHSVGEYVAACVAGSLSLPDAMALVTARARLMQALPAGGAMAAVMTDEGRVREAVERYADRVAIAAVNGPENTVISGDAIAIDEILGMLARDGVKAQRLTVSHAFHSPRLEPMLDAFAEVASRASVSPPRLTFVSNVTGGCVGPAFVPDAAYWRLHARQAVRFADGVSALYAKGCRLFVEVGPQPTLLALGRRAVPASDAVWLPSLRKGRRDWDVLLDAVSAVHVRGAVVDWRGFDKDYRRRKVTLPSYPFQRERHWIEPPAAGADAGPAERSGQVSPELFHAVHWREHTAADGGAEFTGTWVVLGEAAGACDALSDQLRASGGRVSRLLPSDASGALHVVCMHALDHAASDDHVETQRRALGAVAVIARDLAARQADSRITIVTRGAAGPVGPGEPAHATLWGFAAALAGEHPELRPACIDLDPGREADVPALVRELRDGSENRVSFRCGRRYVARLSRGAIHGDVMPPLRGDAAYLVTGGGGALGLQIVEWLLARGACRIAVAGRRGATAGLSSLIEKAKTTGADVRAMRADVSVREDVRQLVADIERDLGPLGGVIHAAGVLDDGIVEQQTWERFARVLAPKLAGAAHLDEVTRHCDLDFFVCFSSLAGAIGSRGQTNYAAANAYLDALATHRRRRGLPGLSIAWGPFAESGMAAGLDAAHRRRWAEAGVELMAPAECSRTLERLLAGSPAHVVVAPIDWSAYVRQLPDVPPLLRELTAGSGAPAAAPSLSRTDLLAAAPEARSAVLSAFCAREVAEVVQLASVRTDVPLSDVGVDSLMAIEIRNRLQRATGVALPIVSFLDGSTIDGLAARIANDVEGAPPGAPAGIRPCAAVTSEQAGELLSRLSELSDSEVEALLATLQPEGT
jgi:acyl transferase domain-containing protein